MGVGGVSHHHFISTLGRNLLVVLEHLRSFLFVDDAIVDSTVVLQSHKLHVLLDKNKGEWNGTGMEWEWDCGVLDWDCNVLEWEWD